MRTSCDNSRTRRVASVKISSRALAQFIRLPFHHGKAHAKRRQSLPGTIVQFARNAPALFILQLHQPAGEHAQASFRRTQLRGSLLDAAFEFVVHQLQLRFGLLSFRDVHHHAVDLFLSEHFPFALFPFARTRPSRICPLA